MCFGFGCLLVWFVWLPLLRATAPLCRCVTCGFTNCSLRGLWCYIDIGIMDPNIVKELEDLKSSINLAHENQRVTQDQVSSCIRNQKNTDSLVTRLEKELREVQEYMRALEDYCISLDTAVRKHHLILTGLNEYKNESLAIVCYRTLQICYPAIEVTDIDYCYRLGVVTGSAKGRPVLVKLVRECIRKEILKSRKNLADNHETMKVYINEDLPQIVNDKTSNIKSVHENAIKRGHNSRMIGTKIMVDNHG